jgi:multidrug efflux pump subunit AcrA (membrane-fusion protein)
VSCPDRVNADNDFRLKLLHVKPQRLHRRLFLPLALALLPVACSKPEGNTSGAAAGEREAVPVTVRPVTVRAAQRSVEVTGTLFGEEDAIMSNKIPGKVIAIYKDVGDRVAPGEELAQLLRNDYELARNQRQSALQEVLARLGTDKVPPEEFDVSKLPGVSRARLQAENARARYERGRQLHERTPPLISDQDIADLQTAFDVAQQGYEVELLTGRGLVGEARTRQAELAIAEQALRDTTIRAPRPFTGNAPAGDGDNDNSPAPATAPAAEKVPAPGDAPTQGTFAVAARYVSVGELLSPISRMFRLVDDDPLKLRAPVREQYVGEMRVGQRALVKVDAYDREFVGEVARISPQVDPASRTFQIEVVIPNAEGLLRPGGFARARVETRQQPDVVFVPRDAVVTFAGVNKVFTVKEGKAQEIAVEVGPRQGADVEVIKGLKGADSVIVSGANRVATGVPVVVNPAVPTGTESAEAPPAPRASTDPR